MKTKVILAVLWLTALAMAQAPAPARPSVPPDPMSWLHAAPALLGEWWKNPEVANELRLTEPQKKQLNEASMAMKLTLIDAGAAGLKSYVQLQSLLDADQLNEAAYNQQLDQIAGAASKLIRDVGQMALTVRRTLTAEQWHKLEAMRQGGKFRERPGAPPMHPHEPMPPRPAPPGS